MAIDGIGGEQALQPVQGLTTTKRAVLEQKLNLAIEKARRNYLEVDNLQTQKLPSTGPTHLGRSVDVRA